MKRMAIFSRLVICLCLIGIVNSFCNIFLPEVTTGPSGPSATCTYKGVKHPATSAGTILVTGPDDCMNCTFRTNFCSCCGYGYKAGPVAIPNSCKRKLNGCYPEYVLKDDESKPCIW